MLIDQVLSHHRCRRIIARALQVFTKINFQHYETKTALKPTWVLGMFRSGTSMITNMYVNLGYNLGPKYQQIRATGNLRHLNPSGFFEDFIFVDLARYFLNLLKRNGQNPPTKDEVAKLYWDDFSIKEFIYYSLVNLNDDRVSTINKIKCYIQLIKYGLDGYMNSKGFQPIIKSPMLSFFYSLMQHKWPESKYIIIFRHPHATLKSSESLTRNASSELYCSYHRFLLDACETLPNVIYLSYDHMIRNPDQTYRLIGNIEGIPFETVRKLNKDLIKKELIRNIPSKNGLNNSALDIYNLLCDRAINVI